MSVIKSLGMPVHEAAELISRVYKHDTRKSKVVIGVLLILIGSTLAVHNPASSGFPHVAWDAFSYLVHGIGAAPLAERFIGTLD